MKPLRENNQFYKIASIVAILVFVGFLLLPLPKPHSETRNEKADIGELDFGKGEARYETEKDEVIIPGQYEYSEVLINHKLVSPKNIFTAGLIIRATQKITIGQNGSIDFSGAGNEKANENNGGGVAYKYAGGGGSHGGRGGSGDCVTSKETQRRELSNPNVSFGGAGALGPKNNSMGGYGGGYILLSAPEIIINGKVIANGTNGTGGGGGGAGGKIILLANNLSINGEISASGGIGGTAFVQGGGGGGGGIVILPSHYNNTGVINVLGGKGGHAIDIYTGCDGNTGENGYIAS